MEVEKRNGRKRTNTRVWNEYLEISDEKKDFKDDFEEKMNLEDDLNRTNLKRMILMNEFEKDDLDEHEFLWMKHLCICPGIKSIYNYCTKLFLPLEWWMDEVVIIGFGV